MSTPPSTAVTASCVALLLVLASGDVAAGVCRDADVFPDSAGKRVVSANDSLFFQTKDLQLDIDGSPDAYGTKDQGLEDVCNGLGPLQPPNCRGNARGSCYQACQAAFRQWSDAKSSPQGLGQFVCSIGLGGGGCSVPHVRLQDSPRDEWFVSETTVQSGPPAGMGVGQWVKAQAAQLDSQAIPYFVIPSSFRKLPWDATPGDLGVVIEARSGHEASFVVGDIGGELNEASARLLATLAGRERLATQMKVDALGVPVARLVGARAGDFRVVIFRHTAPLLPKPQRGGAFVLSKTAQGLPDWIRNAARQKLEAIGGRQRVIDCTEP